MPDNKACPKCASTNIRISDVLPTILYCCECRYSEGEDTWNIRPIEDKLRSEIETFKIDLDNQSTACRECSAKLKEK